MFTAENYPKKLDTVITNPELIYVFDDVVNAKELEIIQAVDWESRSWVNGYNTWPGPPGKGMPVGDLLCEKMVDRIKQLDRKAKIQSHVGSYYVLRDQVNELLEDNIHRDYYDFQFAWTGVFHLIGNSGPTFFYRTFDSLEPIKSVDFKPGRLIIFPSLYAHKAGLTNPGSLRLVHSVRLILKSRLNERYYQYCQN
jgi:hypothetical protein